MCGIIAVVRRRSRRGPRRRAAELLGPLDAVPGLLDRPSATTSRVDGARRRGRARSAASTGCCGACPASQALLRRPLAARRASSSRHRRRRRPDRATSRTASTPTAGRRSTSSRTSTPRSVRLKDAVWAIARDRLRTARAVADLAGPDAGVGRRSRPTLSIQQALSALDRLEVRGRDSAGLHVLVRDHGLDLDVAGRRAGRSAERADDAAVRRAGACARPTATSASSTRRRPRSASSATTRARCAPQIRADDAAAPGARRGPTPRRWCSATPAGPASASSPRPTPTRSTARRSTAPTGPYVTAALNGDVDNFADLKATEGAAHRHRDHHRRQGDPHARVPPPRPAGPTLRRGVPRRRSPRSRARSPSPPASAAAPDELLLALRGSGQALYVGLAEDAFIVASEPYGVVEETDDLPAHGRRDAGRPRQPAPAAARSSRSTPPAPARSRASRRWSYDGTELPVVGRRPGDGARSPPATSTGATRPHFLLKEITEAPSSFRKTLRGKLVERDGVLDVRARPDETLPDDVRADAARRAPSRRVLVIGQGTAAVAGQSLAVALDAGRAPTAACRSRPMLATELSGFGLRADMSRHARRGDQPVGHHHRHQPHRRPRPGPRAPGHRHRQPPQQRPHRQVRRRALHVRRSRRRDERGVDQGVLLPDRGRLPAGGRHRRRGRRRRRRLDGSRRCSRRCATCPTAMAAHPRAAAASSPRPPSGSRPAAATGRSSATASNRIAAARGADQAVRALLQVDRLRRHRGQEAHRPVVRAADPGVRRRPRRARPPTTWPRRSRSTGPTRPRRSSSPPRARSGSRPRCRRSSVPPTAPDAGLRAVAPWSATCSATRPRWPSTRQARPLREARGAIEAAVTAARGSADADDRCSTACGPQARAGSPAASSTACAPAPTTATSRRSTAVRLASLLRYALGVLPLEAYQIEYGKVGTPSVVVEDLTLGAHPGHRGADPPGRRHQAPGQDRHRRHLPLRRDAAAGRRWSRRCSPPASPATGSATTSLRTLGGARPARRRGPRLHPLPHRGSGRRHRRRRDVTVSIVDRGGIARDLPLPHRATTPRCGAPSTGSPPSGSSRWPRAAATAARSLIVPEVKDKPDHGPHAAARAARRAPAADRAARRCSQGYRGRYNALQDAVTETEPTFRDDLLATDPRRRPADRADLRPGRPLALASSGRPRSSARSRRDRHRASTSSRSTGSATALARTPGHRRPAASPTDETGLRRCARRDPTERFAARFAAKEAVMKALGVGLGERRAVGDIEVRARRVRRSRRSCCTAARPSGAGELGVTAGCSP